MGKQPQNPQDPQTPILGQLHHLIKSGISYLQALEESGVEGLEYGEDFDPDQQVSRLARTMRGKSPGRPASRDTRQPAPGQTASTRTTPPPQGRRPASTPEPTRAAGTPHTPARAPKPTAPHIPDAKKALEYLHTKIHGICSRCVGGGTTPGHTGFIMGEGNPYQPPILILLDEPNPGQEHQAGRPPSQIMTGEQTELMENMLKAIQVDLKQVYITTVLKCAPHPKGSAANHRILSCTQLLQEQIAIIKPGVILGFGSTAATAILRKPNLPVSQVRGRWYTFAGYRTIITHSLGDLSSANSRPYKVDTWQDLKEIRAHLDTTTPLPGHP